MTQRTAAASLLFSLALVACGSGGSSNGETGSTGTDPTGTSTAPASGSEGPSSSSTASETGASEGGSTATGVDSSGTDSTGGEVVELHGACPLADRVGGFLFDMEASYSAFSGAVSDGVVPVTVLEQVGTEGDCVLLRRNNPFCDPLCSPGETCDFTGECIPYPTNHDVGVVSVTGLFDEVMVEPIPPTYSYFDTSLSHPAFEPGAALELTATGGDYAAFELHGNGVAMVEPLGDQLVLSTDEAVDIEWTASGTTNARLRLELNVDQHGLTPVSLVCDAEDDGSLEVSAQLVSDFLAFGVSGFPRAEYYLQTADSVTIEPGCVDLVVRSHATRQLSVSGHIPCDDPSDCPAGEHCNLAIQTCEPD